MKHGTLLSCALLLAMASAARADDPNENFIVRTPSKAPAVVAAVKAYSEQRKRQHLGGSKVKTGEVTLVKICIPEVSQLLWPVGLHLSAMLPYGNVGVYRKGEQTEVSVLHPRYMDVLYPHPATEKAGTVAQPLLSELLDSVTQ